MSESTRSVTFDLIGETYALLANSLHDQERLLRQQADVESERGRDHYAERLRATAARAAELLAEVRAANGAAE